VSRIGIQAQLGLTLTFMMAVSVVVRALQSMMAFCRMDSATLGATRYCTRSASSTTCEITLACTQQNSQQGFKDCNWCWKRWAGLWCGGKRGKNGDCGFTMCCHQLLEG